MTMKKEHITQIDIIKAICIFAVIIIHIIAMYREWLYATHSPYIMKLFSYPQFHLQQGIPIFFILMGLNMGNSFSKSADTSLKSLYSKNYFSKRFLRIIIPFFIIFCVSSILWYVYINNNSYPLNVFYIWGLLPFSGPGNYFLGIVIQLIFLFPLIYWFFNKYPLLSLILSFVITFTFYAFAQTTDFFIKYPFLYQACSLRYFFPIVLGFWLSKDRNMHSKVNILLLILGFVVFIYMLASIWNPNLTFILRYDFTYHFPIYSFYAFAITLLGLRYLPSKIETISIKSLSFIGKATFHIFLAQDMFFAAMYWQYSTTPHLLISNPSSEITAIAFFIICLVFCISIGIIFFLLEGRFTEWLRQTIGRFQRNESLERKT